MAVALRAVALNATGSSLAAAGADHTVRFWNLATGEQQPPLRYPAPVNSVAFDPSRAERLATACADNQGPVWDRADGGAKLSPAYGSRQLCCLPPGWPTTREWQR
ncbi:MAG: hypothetical protein R3E79_39035 [Caldilineaceae bacterium]